MNIEPQNIEPHLIGAERGAGWKSAATSAAIHLLILVALIVLWRSTPSSTGGDTIRNVDLVLAQVSADEKTEYFDDSKALPNAQPSASLADLLPTDQPPVSASPASSSSPAVEVPAVVMDAGAMTQVSSGAAASKKAEGVLSEKDLADIAEEQRLLAASQPRGEPASISVFGSGGMTGRKFVFLLDRSNSMGSGGLGVLDRAATELQNAVKNLTDVHQFQVVAYHHETVMIDQRLAAEGDAGKQEQGGGIRLRTGRLRRNRTRECLDHGARVQTGCHCHDE